MQGMFAKHHFLRAASCIAVLCRFSARVWSMTQQQGEHFDLMHCYGRWRRSLLCRCSLCGIADLLGKMLLASTPCCARRAFCWRRSRAAGLANVGGKISFILTVLDDQVHEVIQCAVCSSILLPESHRRASSGAYISEPWGRCADLSQGIELPGSCSVWAAQL